ncbi:hypothetical protein [Methylobacillus sp.]|uniref:hypothetical protein n=1 Tax=Methylobacillus sp. TaxID=56818 RepID=UPI002FE298D1
MPIADTHCPATSAMTFPEKWPSIGDMPWRLQHATGAKPTQTSHHGIQCSHVGIMQEAVFFQGLEEVMLICKKPKHFYELRRVIAMACGIPTVGQTMIGVVGKQATPIATISNTEARPHGVRVEHHWGMEALVSLPYQSTSRCPISTPYSAAAHSTQDEAKADMKHGIDSHLPPSQCREQSERN